MGPFADDLKYAFRMLIKHPGFAGISVVALALGIGLTATMWSITYGGIMRGLPVEDAGDIMYVGRTRPSHDIEEMGTPVHDYEAWRASQRSFEDLSAWYEGTVNVSGTEARPERFEGAFITASAFRMLRVAPVLGRAFTDEDNVIGAPPVVMIGFDMWSNRFGRDSAIVGKTLRANGITSEIIGVMPRDFEFPTNASLWLPLRLTAATQQPWASGPWLNIMGRLKPGVSPENATDDLAIVSRRLEQEHVKENEGIKPVVQEYTSRYIGDEPTMMLWTMMGAVFGVLLIACSNVANLLLARAAVRTKEVAIRTALGASRWRVVSQLLTESLVLSATGALLGMGIAWVGVRLFNNALLATDVPYWIKIGLDGPVLLFVTAVTVLAALVSGVVPSLQATRSNMHDVLKDESRGASSLRMGRFSKGLVVVELALSGGLLVAAGFMIQSVIQISKFDYGVPTQNNFTARVGLFETSYPDSASHFQFWRDLEARLAELPPNRGYALMTVLPGLNGWQQAFGVEGTSYTEDRDYPETRRVAVSPGWFGMFRVAALEGRLLNEGDLPGSQPVAVVSRGFVEKHFHGQSPLGKRIRIGTSESREPWLTIVGVVPEVWYDGSDEDNEALRALVITPLAQADYRFVSIAVAANSDPMAFTEPVRAAVGSIDADQPIYFVRTHAAALKDDNWFYAVFGALFAVFGAAALFLATIGVYGVMSFAVSRRTQEVGIRMALGAQPGDVLRLFLRQGGLQIIIGLLLSIGLAFGLSSGLKFVMFQVDITNPLMYAGVTLALALTGLGAIFIPARRATRVDPLLALRYD